MTDRAKLAATSSAAYRWRPLRRFIARDVALARWAAKGRGRLFAYEFVRFGIKQAWACLFGGAMLALLLATHFGYPKGAVLARYDFLVLAAVAIQAGMIALKLETWEEAKVILLFHCVGTLMEVFKTSVGSWIYPEPGLLKVCGVPLFTGFMYGAVGSYIARCWRLFDFRFTAHPDVRWLAVLSLAIYLNFFAHHYVTDIRLGLFAMTALLFGRCWIYFKIWRVHRRMPLLLGLGLVAVFIWFAENIGTFTAAWAYPNQKHGWAMVSTGKLGAWYLLMIISYTLVAWLHGVEKPTSLRLRQRPIEVP
jgi:uncharacterized membrane protein YoaT (DUF817 family)